MLSLRAARRSPGEAAEGMRGGRALPTAIDSPLVLCRWLTRPAASPHQVDELGKLAYATQREIAKQGIARPSGVAAPLAAGLFAWRPAWAGRVVVAGWLAVMAGLCGLVFGFA